MTYNLVDLSSNDSDYNFPQFTADEELYFYYVRYQQMHQEMEELETQIIIKYNKMMWQRYNDEVKLIEQRKEVKNNNWKRLCHKQTRLESMMIDF